MEPYIKPPFDTSDKTEGYLFQSCEILSDVQRYISTRIGLIFEIFSMYHRLAMKKLTTTSWLSSKRLCYQIRQEVFPRECEVLICQSCEILTAMLRKYHSRTFLPRPDKRQLNQSHMLWL